MNDYSYYGTINFWEKKNYIFLLSKSELMEVHSIYHKIKDCDCRSATIQKKSSKVYPTNESDIDLFKEKNYFFDNSDENHSHEKNDASISVGLFKSLIEKNLYSESICFNFHEIENIVNAQNINYFQNNEDLLEYLGEIEKIIIMKIKFSRKQSKTSKFHKNVLKDMAFNLLEDKLREYSKYTFLLREVGIACAVFFEKFYKDGEGELLEGEEQVLNYLNDAASERSNSRSFSFCVKFGENDQEKNERIAAALRILKKHFKRNYSILIDSLKKHFNTNNFPTFLIRAQECKLRRKINQNYLPKFKEIYLRNNFLNSLEYLILFEKIRDISHGKMKIFDQKILNLEAREILLKIILIISTEVFSRVEDDEYFSLIYKNNIEKYTKALHLVLPNEELRKYISVRKFYDSGEMKILNENRNSQIWLENEHPEPSYHFERIQNLFADLECSIKKDLPNYLFIILSLCLMFNNYDLINKKIDTTSAREKECLRRVLLAFNTYYQYESLDVWKFNQILESVIFSQFFTNNYSFNMVKSTNLKGIPLSHNQDKHLNRTLSKVADKTKIKIPFDRINLILRTNENINQELREAYFTLLASIPQKQKYNFCKNLCDFFKDFFLPYKEMRTYINLNYTRLIPYDKYNHSSHSCIIIHGFIATNQNLYTQWENFIIDFDIYVDFYFFTWDSKTVLKVLKDIMKFLGGLSLTLLTRNFLKVFGAYRTYQHKNNLFAKTTKISEYAGKILAYVLASKAFFEKRAITIVGFSLGGHVLKHCIKELILISSYVPEIRDLIQNVVFIGAATSTSNHMLWENLHKIISGRVINCYNKNDEVLQGIFKYITQKDPMGIGPLTVESENNAFIENYDFAELNIKHVEYKNYLNWIIKKINLF